MTFVSWSATIAVVLIQGNGGQGLIKYEGMAELIVETGISTLVCQSAPCNGTQLQKQERRGKGGEDSFSRGLQSDP